MKIESGRIINDFIEPNKRQYCIPVYQRNYEWPAAQCEKLFSDIILAEKRDVTHFCGSIVYALLKEEHNIQYYVIIDGQQRMTTIYILIKALLDCADTDKDREALTETLINKDKYEKYAIDLSSKLKLKPIKSDNDQLSLLMDNKYDKMDKTSGIWKNYELFCRLIEKEKNAGVEVRNIYRGIEKLQCAKIRLESDDNAQEIFERINSTGLPLSLEDKIRNYVLMTDVNQEELYTEYWLNIENLVGRVNMTAFFLIYINFKSDSFVKEEDAYELFKEVYVTGSYTNERMLKEILRYAEYYNVFSYGSDKYGSKVRASLDGLCQLKQTTIYLFLFRVFDDYHNGVISLQQLESVVSLLLNYSIRRLVCEIGSNSLRGLYKTLYSRVFMKAENLEHYYDAILSFLLSLTSKDTFPRNDVFVEALKTKNLYRKYALCKYLLSSIENSGKEHIQTDTMSIEHIMPQNKNLSTAWQHMLGENWESDKDRLLHTLGNLTLTGYNSELGDKPFAEKKEFLLDQGGSKAVILYEDVKDCDIWNARKIEERAEHLSKIVVDIYPENKPTVEVTFEDDEYQEYTCEDPYNATNKYINYYVLEGERVNVSTFIDMLKNLVAQLYQSNASVLESLALQNSTVVPYSQFPLISFDESCLKNPFKVKGTDIYIATGFPAAKIINIVKYLLEKCDIDESEFIYSAKEFKKNEIGDANTKNVELSSFWQEFIAANSARGGLYKNIPKTEYIGKAVKNTGALVNCCLFQNSSRVELYIDSGDAEKNKALYDYLESRKSEIESDVNENLKWERLETRKVCRISKEVPLTYLSIDQRDDLIEFLLSMSKRFMEVFSKYSQLYLNK